MIKWHKKGLIFNPKNYLDTIGYAQCPVAFVMEDKIRVFFSSRDQNIYSHIYYVDLDVHNPSKIIDVKKHPILKLGNPGMFDAHGTIPTCIMQNQSSVYLYYTGWSRRVDVPYDIRIGLAVSKDGGYTFEKYQQTPILDRNKSEPFFTSAPYVFIKNNVWHMYYIAGNQWKKVDNHFELSYSVRHALSNDGIHWERNSINIIPLKDDLESIGQFTIYERADTLHMWFSYRGFEDFRDGKNAYRIGYAYSKDNKNWIRDDSKSGIDISKTGWDSKMICYPSIVQVNNKLYMFYNGNTFGKEGFGYAEAEIEG